MIRFLFTFLFAAFFVNCSKAQNIYTALRLNRSKEYETKKPTVIEEENIFYDKSGKKVKKSIKEFDSSGMLLVEQRFDEENNLTEKLTYLNDTINKIKLSRTIGRWDRFGSSIKTAYYSYNATKQLIETVDKDEKGNVIWISKLTVNNEGYPTELSLFDGRGNSYGKEVAEYLYSDNKVVTTVLNNNGRVITTDTLKYNFNQAPEAKKTIDRQTSRSKTGEITVYEYERDFDEYGNCLEERIYKIDNKGKRKPDRVFKKKYTYK